MSDVQIPAEPAARPVATFASATRLSRMKKELTMLAVLIGLAGLTALLNPVFLSPDNLRNTVRHISLISLFALGEAVVIIAGGIDLSVGSIICISAVTTSYLTMYAGFGIGAAVVGGHRALAAGRSRAGARDHLAGRAALRRHAGLDAAACAASPRC